MRGLVESDDLSAEIGLTRWHPVDSRRRGRTPSLPLPATADEEQAEYAAREAAELGEARLEGRYDWEVKVRLPERSLAVDLADRLATEALPVTRRWRYVVRRAATEEAAQELADRLRSELPADADVRTDWSTLDPHRSPLQSRPVRSRPRVDRFTRG